MLRNPPLLLLSSLLIFRQALALSDPRAVDLSGTDNPAAILPEHHNYGLFDRAAPILINVGNTQQQDIVKLKRTDSMVSADPVPTTPAADATTNAPLVSAAATMSISVTGTNPAYPTTIPTDLTYATDTDTYLLPSAYDSAQLSSLFAAESSFISEASTLLSAFPTSESGVACTGVSDVSGEVVTVCGPTGDPRSTGTVKNAAGKGRGYVSWVCLGLGIVGGGVAFLL